VMGKKDKDKKKGKGAEKTAEKTEKKAKLKAKKQLAAAGEDDIESIVKAIEAEEKARQEVVEVVVEPPGHRSSFSMTAHPDNPEIVFFGGEFYNGQRTAVFNDLLVYSLKRLQWTQIKSPGGPPPRAAHQAAMVSQAGGQLWIFGGEFTSPNESQFYHYKDLWCFHFASKRWEKVVATGGPSARSGHRMVVSKKLLLVFGGFHDNLRECKYYNDLYSFNLESRVWTKLAVSGPEPSPRSACQLFTAPDGRIVVYGGFCKEKVKRVERGVTHADMYLLSPDKHDPTGTKWRWQTVKQVGQRPEPLLRTGLCSAVGRDGRVYLFGGVMDTGKEGEEEEESDDEEEEEGRFFNELYSVAVEGERATWFQVTLTGRKDPGEKKKRRKDKEDVEEEGENVSRMAELELEEGPTTVTVESGQFTVSSTVGEKDKQQTLDAASAELKAKDCCIPCPRFSGQMVFKGGLLYLYGGLIEAGDKDITLKDFYSLDTAKMDSWNVIIENDEAMEWLGDEEDEEDDESDDESGMETD